MAKVFSDEDFDELTKFNFSLQELVTLQAFLEPFCPTARLYLARIFVRAKLFKKTFESTVCVCLKEWENVWQYGTPERLGDPDDTATVGNRPPDSKNSARCAGWENTLAFYRVYAALGIPAPKFLF